jgi:hypothetical protein
MVKNGMLMDTRFIGEPIAVEFDRQPLFSKRPHCPDRFIWNGETFSVTAVLEQWVDFGRRGRMAQNMQPEHAARAAEKGSWGVGRYFFRVTTSLRPGVRDLLRPRPARQRPRRGAVVCAAGTGRAGSSVGTFVFRPK